MDLGLRGKIAVVCAASKGLGRASAAGLAAEGAHLVICARREDELRETADAIAAETGVRVVPVIADMGKQEDIERLIETAKTEFGGFDILVCNAGGPPPGYFMDITDEQWQTGFEMTLMSAIRLIRLAIPVMRERGGGRIVNIVSISVKQPIENLVISNSIRAGVIGLAKTLAQQLGPDQITVNNVLPGTILTDRITSLSRHRAESQGITLEEAIEASGREVPLGRIGQPDDLGSFVTYLASARAAWITGTSTQIDGGTYRGLM